MSQTYIPVALERLVLERCSGQCAYCRCLAVREETYRTVFGKEQTQRLLQNRNIRLIVFHPEQEVILQWIR
jgi:hypothetical protein